MANINLFDLVRLIDDRIKYALLKFRTGATDASPSPRPVAHGFFSLTHTDTVPGSPARGQIVRANQTPAWESFYANTLGYMVQGNGVDVVSAPFNWNTIAGASGAYMVHDHSSTMYGGPILRSKYRQFVYVVNAGDFSFVKTSDGQPVMALQTLE